MTALFDPNRRRSLIETQATPEAVTQTVPGQSYLHFSCHGFYNWRDPIQSGLLLAGKTPLTLAEIITKLDLSACRLVTLSACETGLTDICQSGAPGVVSTLWAVDDLSTMLLMEHFYQHHLQDAMHPAAALRQAQFELRDLTAAELCDRFAAEREALLAASRMSADVIEDQYWRFAAMDPNKRPFAHPYYWAAFIFSGV